MTRVQVFRANGAALPNKGPIGPPKMEGVMKVLGIDVGLTGALALVEDEKLVDVIDMPTLERGRANSREVDAAALQRELEGAKGMGAQMVVIEAQGAAPGQGLGSTFGLGVQYGLILGLVQAIRFKQVVTVRPSVWKAAMRLGSDKELSRSAANKLWPGTGRFERKKDHGRAEAALLAKWALLAHARDAAA